jgi:hypothetical protein
MDYSAFRFVAVVDFMQFEIQTAKPTNFWTIKKRFGLDFVEPQNAGEGGAATVFRFKLQDPHCWHEVVLQLQAIAQEFALVAPPIVTAIEVSFDAYSNGAIREELVELTARLYKFQANVVSDNRRFEGSGKGVRDGEGTLGGFDRVRRLLGSGRVIAIGHQRDDKWGRWKADPESQRIYFKTTDRGGETLPDNQHRARIEKTLQGSAIVNGTLEHWEAFKFETLSDSFRFRALKGDLNRLLQLSADRTEQIGERRARARVKSDRTAYSGSRLYSSATKADTDLNRRARRALRDLSARWRSQPKQRFTCGKWNKNGPPIPPRQEDGGRILLTTNYMVPKLPYPRLPYF